MTPEARQARLEEDFERLKQEVKGELRQSWRQWFFHPAWTVAASALLVASLAIHFSPRAAQPQPTIYLRGAGTPPPEGPARGIRNRERIPAPQPHVPAEVPSGEAAPAPPPPPVLLRANALRDLELPALDKMTPAAPVEDQPAVVSEAVILDESDPEPEQREPGEITPVLTPGELAALVSTPVDDGDITIIDMSELAGMDPPQVVERSEAFDENERIRSLTALAGMQIASGETADAWKTLEMLRRYSPDAAAEMSALITKTEAEVVAEPEPTPAEPAPTIHVYIQPIAPAPAPVAAAAAPAPVPDPEPELTLAPEEPSPAPARTLKSRPRKRFTTDPYLRDD